MWSQSIFGDGNNLDSPEYSGLNIKWDNRFTWKIKQIKKNKNINASVNYVSIGSDNGLLLTLAII